MVGTGKRAFAVITVTPTGASQDMIAHDHPHLNREKFVSVAGIQRRRSQTIEMRNRRSFFTTLLGGRACGWPWPSARTGRRVWGGLWTHWLSRFRLRDRSGRFDCWRRPRRSWLCWRIGCGKRTQLGRHAVIRNVCLMHRTISSGYLALRSIPIHRALRKTPHPSR